MNDPKTKDDLDSLADLFLTGTIPGREKGAAGAGSVAGIQPGQRSGVAMNPSRPVRLGPKLTKPRVTSPTIDQPWYSWADRRVPPKAKDVAASSTGLTSDTVRDLGQKQTAAAGQPGTSQQEWLNARARPMDGVLGAVGGSTSPIKRQAQSRRRDLVAGAGVRVETVVLGSLPVFADPWLAQYAHHVASKSGPVAVLHVAQERIGLEVITSSRGELTGGLGRSNATGGAVDFGAVLRDQLSEVDSPIQMLDRLIGAGPNRVRSILVHLEGAAIDQTIAAVGRVGSWTILCGAYESAIADACRLIQRSVGAGQSSTRDQFSEDFSGQEGATGSLDLNGGHAGLDCGSDRRPVGVMIMGADEAQGRTAIQRLRGALADLRLEISVEFVGSRKQMAAVNRLELADFPAADGGLQELMGYLEELAKHNEATAVDTGRAAPISSGAMNRTSSAPAPVTDETDEVVEIKQVEPRIAVPGVIRPAHSFASSGAGSSRTNDLSHGATGSDTAEKMSNIGSSVGQTRKPSSEESDTSAEPDDLDLSTLLCDSLAGAISLQARCPHKPRTQLVLDEAGRLHLLHRHVSAPHAPGIQNQFKASSKGSSSGADLRSALVDLIETRTWVQEHLELLRMTQRQCRFDDRSAPELHLFTDDAKQAAAMAAKLGDWLKLHLLQEVRIGEASRWVCTDLN